MIHRTIFFIWLSDWPALPGWLVRNVHSFQRHNPGFRVRLIRDFFHLVLPVYRPAIQHCKTASMRSDLLRYSLLEAHGGGWYFDADCFSTGPLEFLHEAMEARLGGRLGSVDFGVPQVTPVPLVAGTNCRAWPALHAAVLKNIPAAEAGDELAFSNTAFSQFRTKNPEALHLFPWRFVPHGKTLYREALSGQPPDGSVAVHGFCGGHYEREAEKTCTPAR